VVSGAVDRRRAQRIRVERAGYQPREVSIAAAAPGLVTGPIVDVAVGLSPAAAPRPEPVPAPASWPAAGGAAALGAAGRIRVWSQPSGAAVWLLVGETPVRIAPLATRVEHELRVASDDGRPAFVTVRPEEFDANGEAHVSTDLRPGAPRRL
jgi:hypothetical protein